MKLHLKKVLGSRALTFEQLAIVLTESEAMLNSRPLLPLALDNGSVPEALTPGHFLIGRPILAPPHMGAQDSKINSQKMEVNYRTHINLVESVEWKLYSTPPNGPRPNLISKLVTLFYCVMRC